MRKLKIFLVVVVFAALTYWGVEPYAHSIVKPHVDPANFNFAEEDLSFVKGIVTGKEALLTQTQKENNTTQVESMTKALDMAKENLAKSKTLWASMKKIDFAKGDTAKGEAFFEGNCSAYHGLKEDGITSNFIDSSAYGVISPDLSSAALLYDEKFLATLILNPALTLKVDHRFGDAFIMTTYNSETSDESEEIVNQNIADVIAYLKEVALKFGEKESARTEQKIKEKYSKAEESTEKTALMEEETILAKEGMLSVESRGRCHDARYGGLFSSPAKNDLRGCLSSAPPDLSMMIRSREEQYLNDFINNTQRLLPGTAMPGVGLNKATQAEVTSYIEEVGDSKKEERESLEIYIMIFFVILSIFAILWKHSVWSKLH